jgi:hypothetical protein
MGDNVPNPWSRTSSRLGPGLYSWTDDVSEERKLRKRPVTIDRGGVFWLWEEWGVQILTADDFVADVDGQSEGSAADNSFSPTSLKITHAYKKKK